MQASSDPLILTPCSAGQGAAWHAGASRKPSATAALTAPARDAIDVLRPGRRNGPWVEQQELRDMRSKR